MGRTKILLAAGLVLALAAPWANGANFVVNSAGPHDSMGPWFTSGNAILFPSYGGPLYLADKITISGTLTKVHQDSLASDSSWWLKASTGFGTAFSFIPQMTTVGAYTTLNVTHNTYGGFWIGNYPQYKFEAVEAANDQPGLDAQWTNMTFEFHAKAPTVSIGWNVGDSAAFDTGGSNFNTKVGLYSKYGRLLALDDGSGAGIDASGLARGTYHLIVGGQDGDFQDWAAMPGTEYGDLVINFNGATIFDGALESERVHILDIQVVPEASTIALTLAGGAALAAALPRRRGARGSAAK